MIAKAFSFFLKLRNRHFLLIDLLSFVITPAIALGLRLDSFEISGAYAPALAGSTMLFLAVKLACLYLGQIYAQYWRYASVRELSRLLQAWLLAVAINAGIYWTIKGTTTLFASFPRSLPLLDGLIGVTILTLVRYNARIADSMLQATNKREDFQRVLIIGAGASGVMLAKQMQQSVRLHLEPVGFVDDDPQKYAMRICGLRVLGNRHAIKRLISVVSADQVLIAMPSASGSVIREIVGICKAAGIRSTIAPGIYELLDRKLSLAQIRTVQIEDLLRRDPVQTDVAAVGELIADRCVLVTGGGGSIGSELCRQVLRFRPRRLVVLGHGENSVFEIQNELRTIQVLLQATDCQVEAVIGDIRFGQRIRAIFEEYRPEIVFHTAAHKHVPLMEHNPSEAITNNILGTHNVLEAAQASGVGHFVMISSDKAVNPTSMMGVSKRVAEYLVHRAARASGRPYVAVRFGNVLGSRGSVVLTFKQQIAAGGPVTVTDPEMTRYFMTIPEAVQLVLQAAGLGHGGEVFMLNMGEPIKIVDLARDMIKLSGLEEGRDIDIQYTGLRPGEKLYEELFLPNEEYITTPHTKIFIASSATSFVPHNLSAELARLLELADAGEAQAIIRQLKRLVPEFQHASLRAARPTSSEARPASPALRPHAASAGFNSRARHQ